MHKSKIVFLLFVLLLSCEKTKTTNEIIPTKNYTTFHKEAKSFCEKKNFNTNYYFLLDMSLHSGKNRFFVYDFKTKKIINQNLVTHGSCDVLEPNKTRAEKAKFSNANDSHCSSLGKYEIGKRDYSSWGINVKYWLHGLEKTNQNAENRVVVLHSWEKVDDKEIYPQYSPLSWGCPAVSDEFMKVLDRKLQQTQKPVLLWIVK